jgi:hypothetical protein
MLFGLVYLMLRRLVGWAAGPSGIERSMQLEILGLRHQIKVLRRKAGGLKLRRWDRVLLAAVSRGLPRGSWASSFLVTPANGWKAPEVTVEPAEDAAFPTNPTTASARAPTRTVLIALRSADAFPVIPDLLGSM